MAESKWMKTMIIHFGSKEAVEEHLKTIGSKGGKIATGNVGFARLTPELRAEYGRKGGSRSRRTK